MTTLERLRAAQRELARAEDAYMAEVMAGPCPKRPAGDPHTYVGFGRYGMICQYCLKTVPTLLAVRV